MSQVVTELIVDGSGALRVLDQYERGMDEAARSTEKSTGAIDAYNTAMSRFVAAQEKGLAITTQKVERISREQRAFENWQAAIDRGTGLEIRLRRESQKAAIDAANAVALGYTTQEKALQTLLALEKRHAAQLSEVNAVSKKTVAATDDITQANKRLAAANDNAKFATANLAAQFQDIAVTSAMGMSPLQIALQQGTQISAVLGPMGAAGAVRGLGAAFLSIVSPVSLVTIGLVAAAAAAIQYFMSGEEKTKVLDELISAHADNIRSLKEAYGEAASGLDDYTKKSQAVYKAEAIIIGGKLREQLKSMTDALVSSGSVVETQADRFREELQKIDTAMQLETDPGKLSALNEQFSNLVNGLGGADTVALQATEKFAAFGPAIDRFAKSARDGAPDYIRLREEVSQAIVTDPSNDALRKLGAELLALIGRGPEVQASMQQTAAGIDLVAGSASSAVGGVMQLSGALGALGAMIPTIAKAEAVQAQIQKANDAYQAGVRDLDRRLMSGALGDGAVTAASIERLNTLREEAIRNVSGLASAEEDLARRTRDATISSMKPREAALERVKDEYDRSAKSIRALGDAGVSQAKIDELLAQNSKTLQVELANTAAGFDKVGSRGRRGLSEAAKAARAAEKDFKSFAAVADRLVEDAFPGEAARKEAEELSAALAEFGDRLSDVQRIAVETRIADQFEAARLGVRELEKDTQDAAKQMAEDLQGALGSVLSDLFTTPMEDLDEFVDSFMSKIADLGAANLERGLEGLFNGKGFAASGGDVWNTGGLNLRSVTRAIEDGARKGAADGSAYGTTTGLGALGGLFSGKNGQMMSAGLGGLGMGYESGNAITGGLGGALSGFLSGGGPLGAIVGGLGGILGGIFGRSRQKRQERKQARDELESNMGAIRDLIDAAMGTPSGSYESAWRDMSDEIAKARKLAKKAGDGDLVKELDLASQTFFDFLVQDWERGLDGVMKAMKSGHGMDSAFVQAQEQVAGLQETLLGFVEDAKFFAETGGDLDKAKLTKAANDNSTTGSAFRSSLEDRKRYYDPISSEYRIAVERYKDELKKLDISAILTTGTGKETSEIAAYDSVDALMKRMTDLGVVFDDLGNILTADQVQSRIDKEKELQKAITEAQEAAQQMALRQLTGAEEFTSIELEIQRLMGTAAGLQTTLEKLGMTADEAADAIEKGLNEALDKLRDTYVKDLTRSLNEMAGTGYINDVTDAMKLYEQRLKDSKALGLDTSLAFAELTLSLRDISREAGLSGKDLDYLAKLFPDLAKIFKGITPTGGVADAQAAVDRAKADLRAAYDEEARAIEATIGRLKSFISSIEDFKASLKLDSQLSPLSPTDRLIEAQKRFQEISTKALAGDETAMGELEGVSRQYLTEARAYYASSEQYFQIFEQVEAILDQALTSAKGQLSVEEKSLTALEQQVSKLIDINDSVLTVAAAIAGLNSAISALDGLGGGGSDFDPTAHWSKSLKEFYSQLQAYKKQTGSEVAPNQIASVWSAFASAGSGKEYDMLARAYTEILKSLMPKSGMRLGGIVGAYANGGLVGNGIYDVDSVIARYAGGGSIALAGGEFVTSASRVNSQTYPTLNHINRTGALPGNDNSALVAELRAEIRALRAELRDGQAQHTRAVIAGAQTVAGAVEGGTQATIDLGQKVSLQGLRRSA